MLVGSIRVEAAVFSAAASATTGWRSGEDNKGIWSITAWGTPVTQKLPLFLSLGSGVGDETVAHGEELGGGESSAATGAEEPDRASNSRTVATAAVAVAMATCRDLLLLNLITVATHSKIFGRALYTIPWALCRMRLATPIQLPGARFDPMTGGSAARVTEQ